MPTTAEYLAAQPDFMDNFQKGSSYVDKLYDQAAQRQAGQQFAQGNYQDASNTLANRGDIQGASTLQDYGQKQFQQRHAYLQQAAPVLQHIYETGGPQAVVGAFEHLAPELQGMGLDADTLNRTRQGLISDPATTLQALNAMAQRKLKFQDDGNGGVFVLDENTGQLVSHQAGNKPLILGKDQVASMPNSPTGMAPPPSSPVGGAAAPGVPSPAPMGSAAPQPSQPGLNAPSPSPMSSGAMPSQPQAPDGYHIVASGPKGDQWRAPTPEEAKQFPGARQINTGTGEAKFAPASMIAGNQNGSTPELTTVDPNSRAITAQTGLSLNAFKMLTGRASELGKDTKTRNAAAQEAQNFANKHGVDVSTLSSQYKAYNDTLQQNIERNNQTKIMEDELTGTIDNLKPVADASAMGTLRIANVAKLFAGQEVSDPTVSQYSFQLQQLRTELAAYSAATQGRTGGSITQQDYSEAERVIKDGLSSKAADGLQKAVLSATDKMSGVLKRNIYLTNKAVWGLFGVGDNYDRLNGGAPSARVQNPSTNSANKPGWSIKAVP